MSTARVELEKSILTELRGEFMGDWDATRVADMVMSIVSDMEITMSTPEQPVSYPSYLTYNQWGESMIVQSLDELEEFDD